MQEIIDVPADVGEFAGRLAGAGVKTVVRYYNHRNSARLPTKCLTAPELRALTDAGLSAAVVFEQRGGAPDRPGDRSHIEDFGAENGRNDASRALGLADELAQPEGSAIYFAVDFDFAAASDLARIVEYFDGVKNALSSRYLVGVYGSGKVGRHLQRSGLVDHMWLAGARGWSGFEDALQSGSWSLFQRDLDRRSPIGGFGFDGNIANPSFDNFGQFGGDAVLRPAPAAALFKVTARSGLNLRSGPGENFKILQTLPTGTIVTGNGLEGSWMRVDLEGDGAVDGYMFASFLTGLSGGLPQTVPPAPPRSQPRPIDVARAELALGVREIPGRRDNPRIVLYHSTTRGGAASDETAWCASFVNYCVEQAGLQGTDSKAALSWENWGHAAASAGEGDIAVFRRRAGNSSGEIKGGHVGFLAGSDDGGAMLPLLGGNQSQSVRIQSYPRDGVLGSFHYKLLSIRRA
jgi:uncharacterized protein (TIGR02594 family)